MFTKMPHCVVFGPTALYTCICEIITIITDNSVNIKWLQTFRKVLGFTILSYDDDSKVEL